MKIKIGLVDDHQLFLKSLSLMLHSLQHYEVVVEAVNGEDLQRKLAVVKTLPDICLVDVSMPVMNGMDTVAWLHQNHPAIKTVALSMNDNDEVIIRMIKAGCCAYLLKDTHPTILDKALLEIHERGYFNADISNINFRRLLIKAEAAAQLLLSTNEKLFLQYACSDLTYKQIAAEMSLSERTIDGYRESLFEKFNVQSRVGLCLEGIRKGYVSL